MLAERAKKHRNMVIKIMMLKPLFIIEVILEFDEVELALEELV